MDYCIGDVIEYRPFEGGSRFVLVDTKEADVKNGRPGFTGRTIIKLGMNTNSHTYSSADSWGYDSQIIRVVRSAR